MTLKVCKGSLNQIPKKKSLEWLWNNYNYRLEYEYYHKQCWASRGRNPIKRDSFKYSSILSKANS